MRYSIDHDEKVLLAWSFKVGSTSLRTCFHRLQGVSGCWSVSDEISALKNPLQKAIFKYLHKRYSFAVLYDQEVGNNIYGEQPPKPPYKYYPQLIGAKIIKILFPRLLFRLSLKYWSNVKWTPNCNYEDYTKILFIRNPYKRIVSGFLTKYVNPIYSLEISDLTFEKFVDELDENELENIEYTHFTPQLSEAYSPRVKFDEICDIGNLDYDRISKLFRKKSLEASRFKQPNYKFSRHNYTDYNDNFTGGAYNLTISELTQFKNDNGNFPTYDHFYNDDIKAKVFKFYKRDFEFFEKHGFKYDLDAEKPRS